jgi:hypothetical protein
MMPALIQAWPVLLSSAVSAGRQGEKISAQNFRTAAVYLPKKNFKTVTKADIWGGGLRTLSFSVKKRTERPLKWLRAVTHLPRKQNHFFQV